MNKYLKYAIVSGLLAVSVGICGTAIVVQSENGYVGSMMYGPLIMAFGVLCFLTLFGGLVTLTKPAGPALLLATLLLPVSFLGTAGIAKYFEWGAYREEPMVSFPPPIANKVVFRSDATDEQIERFWTHIIGTSDSEGGMSFRPGVRSATRSGHRTITSAFRDDATEEEKDYIRERIRNYRPVHQYLENVDTLQQKHPEPNIDNVNTKKPVVIAPREPNTFKTVQ